MAEAACNRISKSSLPFHPFVPLIMLLVLATRAWAGGVNLAWDAVNSSSLAGYVVYYGPSAGSYTTQIDVGNRTTYSVSNLADGTTYHFAVTAYDAAHLESAFSNDVVASVAAGAPVASFTASATSGVAPLAMNFTSTSTGSIAKYAWSFGDGTTSTSPSPGHVYAAAGVYTVSLTVSGSSGSSTKTMPNYVTVTSGGDATPPSVPGALVGSASGTSVNLSWQAATDNVSVTGYRLERCDGATCASFVQVAAPSGTSFTDAGRTPGATYRYRVRAADGAGNLGGYSNIVDVSLPTATTGALNGSLVNSSAAVNLTAMGTSDWVQWPNNYRKATGGAQISGYTTIGGATANSYKSDARSLSWTDGVPTSSGSSTAGAAVSSVGGGVQFTVPADATTRTVVVYVGAQNTTGTLRAHLSDASSPDYVANYSAQQRRVDGAFTLTYRAASAGQRLTVTWVKANQSAGNVSVQGAALAGGGVVSPPIIAGNCPCSAWTASTVPTVADNKDWQAVELGVKFRTDVGGLVSSVRFFKSTANGGTHVGNLWRSDGTLLAQAIFVNETASGWQQVDFNPPVPIVANTTYVASYHTDTGHYAGDNWFFTNAGVDNGPLHLLRDGFDGGSGVYAYGASSFPSSTYSGTNYWVDVIFMTSP